MTPHPVIFRKLERRGSECLVHVDEVVHDQTLSRTLQFDAPTFSRLEEVFSVHPFQKKPATDDVVLFRSLDTPLNDTKKYLGLMIVNSGSRHHLKIEASEEAFAAMQIVHDSWSRRFKEENNFRFEVRQK